jgi:hypothetical protein
MKSSIRIFVSLIVIIFLLLCIGTESDNHEAGFVSGTVIRGGVEGPAFGIRTDDGKNFDPMNLPDEFKTYGKRILFKFIVRDYMTSVHMRGTIIEIKFIHEI